MTVGTVNNWVDLGVTGRVDVDALTVGGVAVTGAGTGTVTSVSVTTANGVSGVVATATTTPAITLTLGAITPTSILAGTTLLTSAAPAAADSEGVAGTVTYDAGFIYVCVATNVWVRAAVTTWV